MWALPKGAWALDPDPAVQAAISAVFRVAPAERSQTRIVRRLIREGIKLPRKFPGRPMHWIAPNIGAVGAILRNPAYTGQYVFRQRVVDRSLPRYRNGNHRARKATPDEQMIVEDHHPAYVSFEQWSDIRAVLRENAPSKNRRNLGPGSAMLQGILGCAMHRGRSMSVDYKWPRKDGSNAHYYLCMGEYDFGGAHCGAYSGRQLDEAVAQVVFERLAAPEIDLIRDEWRTAKRDRRSETEGGEDVLVAARRRLEDLRVDRARVNPSLRNLIEDLDIQIDEALGEIKGLERSAATRCEPLDVFTPEKFEELRSLCVDLPGTFYAKTTAHRDRKEILRVMIAGVELTEHKPEHLKALVYWSDGSDPTEVTAYLMRYPHKIIKELAAEGLGNQKIANRLNEMGLMTSRHRNWTTPSVWQARRQFARRQQAAVAAA